MNKEICNASQNSVNKNDEFDKNKNIVNIFVSIDSTKQIGPLKLTKYSKVYDIKKEIFNWYLNNSDNNITNTDNTSIDLLINNKLLNDNDTLGNLDFTNSVIQMNINSVESPDQQNDDNES